MADATVTVTKTLTSVTGSTYVVYGSLAVSASPDVYVTGGNTLSFKQSGIKATRKPVWVQIQGKNGYDYSYIPGTNAFDGKLRVNTTANTELTAAAIPTGVSGDVIAFRAEFPGEL